MNRKRLDKFIQISREIASSNPFKWKHVSLIVKGSKILSIGTNNHKTHTTALRMGYTPENEVYYFRHSELDALLKCKERNKITLVNFRFNPRGELRNSCPCEVCMPWCKATFKDIYFSTTNSVSKLIY